MQIVQGRKVLIVFLILLIIASFLRLYRISDVPVSLFGDELDVGYHAYSILKTGRDYSGNFMPLHFHSLAEFRTPLFLYSAVPTVAIFGISPLGVRLPAAIFGVLGVLCIFLLVREVSQDNLLALAASATLTFSPWHIQYSRAAFEVTQLLFFLLGGLYFYFKALKGDGKWLVVATVGLSLTIWIYSTAKLFTPFLIFFLFFLYRRELLKLPKKHLFLSLIVGFFLIAPFFYTVFWGGGAQRFGYLSVFTDPTVEPEVGTARLVDAQMRGEKGLGLSPSIQDRVFHNKFVLWGSKIANNYFESFSSDFFFNKGDPNLRHSIEGVGQFYKIESVALILGLLLFFTNFNNKKFKFLIVFWLLAGVIPSSITRDGGRHATRLILILPPLVFLMAYGLLGTLRKLKGYLRFVFLVIYLLVFTLEFVSYQHNYWVHNPSYSERWWHAGFREAINEIKKLEDEYSKVIISTQNEPPWIFFAAWYEFPPDLWQREFPLNNKVNLDGYGEISHIGKFYFGSPQEKDIYGWYKVLNLDTLYLATEKEVKINLILEPERVPAGIKLVKSIPFPSGEPAFYLFSGDEKTNLQQ